MNPTLKLSVRRETLERVAVEGLVRRKQMSPGAWGNRHGDESSAELSKGLLLYPSVGASIN